MFRILIDSPALARLLNLENIANLLRWIVSRSRIWLVPIRLPAFPGALAVARG